VVEGAAASSSERADEQVDHDRSDPDPAAAHGDAATAADAAAAQVLDLRRVDPGASAEAHAARPTRPPPFHAHFSDEDPARAPAARRPGERIAAGAPARGRGAETRRGA